MIHSFPAKCFITDLETKEYNSPSGIGFNMIKYQISLHGKQIPMIFSPYPSSWSKDLSYSDDIEDLIRTVITPYKHILCGLLYNEQIQPNEDTLFNIEFIKNLVNDSKYPSSINDKLVNLFLSLMDCQHYDGQLIEMGEIYKSERWKNLYFKNVKEFNFYTETLIEQGLIINPRNVRLELDGKFIDLAMTYKGLGYASEIREKGNKSNKCFVAMSFDKEEDKIYFEAIKPACNDTGFDARRIDYENYDSIQTVNDAIISLIKDSKFCIADFTRQRAGVYFEAGYAAGRGLEVIYTCRKDHFSQSHFDTNHFPHIIYSDTDSLKKALIDKINVRIKE